MAKPGTCRRYIGNIGAKESGGSGRCGNSTITSEPPTVGAERTPLGPAALPIGRFRFTRLRWIALSRNWQRAEDRSRRVHHRRPLNATNVTLPWSGPHGLRQGE
jgi:hypothetical protein